MEQFDDRDQYPAQRVLVFRNKAGFVADAGNSVQANSGGGQFILGSPAGQNRETVWNVPIMPTNAVTANKLWVIDV